MTLVWVTTLLLALPARGESVSSRAVAWAAESPRPAECGGVNGLWQVARRAFVASACRGLARGYAALDSLPEAAFAEAERVLQAEPDFASARILRGRALFRLGRAAEALNDLSRLLVESAALSAEPAALLEGGRAALARADLERALAFYRALGSRAALLPDRPRQATAYLEIASVLLASGADGDEVSGYLGEGRRRASATGLADLATGLFALNLAASRNDAAVGVELGALTDPAELSRFENEPEASRVGAALLEQQTKMTGARAGRRELDAAPGLPRAIYLPDGLLHAVMALAFERSAPALSRAEYAAFAASPLGQSRLSAALAARQARSTTGAGRPAR